MKLKKKEKIEIKEKKKKIEIKKDQINFLT